MVLDFDAKDFFDRRFDILNPRITKFNHFTSIRKDDVIVLFGTVGFFELRNVFTELVFPNQITGQEQFDCIVQRCSRNTVILILHFDVQRLDIEMTFVIVYFRQNRKTFGCFAVAILLEISRENVTNRILQILLLHASNL